MQAVIHAALLGVAGLACLPPLPGAGWAPPGGETPAGWILATLLVTLGLAFFALAATTPLVSAWVARAENAEPGSSAAPDVYRLYALSNAGSLIGLAIYPLILEPLLGLSGQAMLWSAGFVVLAGATALAGFLAARAPASSSSPKPRSAAGFHLSAFVLAAVGSLALVAVTTHLTRDVAAVPFLWAAPLAIYLLTFVLAFRGGDSYPRRLLVPVLVASVAACLFVWFQDITYGLESALVAHAAAALSFLFVGCWITHGEIARRKPAPSRLTGFYLLDDGRRGSRGCCSRPSGARCSFRTSGSTRSPWCSRWASRSSWALRPPEASGRSGGSWFPPRFWESPWPSVPSNTGVRCSPPGTSSAWCG